MERFIKILAFKLARKQAERIFSDDFKIAYYVFQGLIGDLLKIVITFTLAYFLDLLIPCIIVVIIFISLRFMIGGYHSDSVDRCLIISVSLILIASQITMVLYNNVEINYFRMIAVTIVFTILNLTYSPKPLIRIKRKNKNKRKIISSLYIIFVCSLSLILNKIITYAVFVGIATQLFTVTESGSRLLKKINEKI